MNAVVKLLGDERDERHQRSDCDDDDDVDSDEESEIGDKCISLLASLLPASSRFVVAVAAAEANVAGPAHTPSLSADAQHRHDNDGNAAPEQKSDDDDVVGVQMDDDDDAISGGRTSTVAVRPRPQAPPKPPIDTLRYSMNNIKESADWQLDELLEELEALETQLNTSGGGDQLLLGMSALPTSSSAHDVKETHCDLRPASSSIAYKVNKPLKPANQAMPTVNAASSCSSPDGDSAFGDASSTESARCRNSAFSSNESCRDSLNTPSPTQTSPRNGEVVATNSEEVKALKIRQALEKMKEAKVTRIFVKLFVEDGAPLQMLIDERWTVAETMRQLTEKNHITLMEDHCIVEEFPELYIKRIFEDHENMVENIQMWVQDSPNKLYFVRRPDKYTFVDRPELYLVTERTTDLDVPTGDNWTREVKQQFVREFFSRETVVPPEMEGFLYLKADGRKSWKKHFFVLRQSGLYYSPKGKKASKDLTCLMNLHSSQVYTGINWEKKYKSPTHWGISIKLTALQIKRSQYIKYICAEDEPTFRKWIVALRIAKNGAALLRNYERACAIRREELGSTSSPATMSSASSFATIHSTGRAPIATRPISVNTRNLSPDFPPTRESNGKLGNDIALPSPSQSSITSSVASRCLNGTTPSTYADYNEQPTGTIKRAPIDVLRRVSRTSSSSVSPTMPQEDTDSDEEFPAPPPMNLATKLTAQQALPPPPKPAYYATTPQATPVAQAQVQRPPPTLPKPALPATPQSAKKAPPPPPPKRSDATRIQTAAAAAAAAVTSTTHISDLEAALARRREKIAQNV